MKAVTAIVALLCVCLWPFWLSRVLSQECYIFVKAWPQWNEDWYFAFPQGIAVGPEGNVYVLDTGNCIVKKFDPSGKLLVKWGGPGDLDGQFGAGHWPGDGPVDVAVDSSGTVYVADTYNYRIQKFDSSGNFLRKWGSQGTGDGEFGDDPFGGGPGGVAVGASGNVFVMDIANRRVQVFDSSGKFLRKWGSEGSGDGQFGGGMGWGYAPGIDIDALGNIYVVDPSNCRVQKFDSSGRFLGKWGSCGSGDGEFTEPRALAVDPYGQVFVVDMGYVIHMFDSQGNFVASSGWGLGLGELGGIAFDSFGLLYVAGGRGSHSVQKLFCDVWEDHLFLSPQTKWGSGGSGQGELAGPESVAVDSSGNVYVADAGNGRIQVFDPSGNFLRQIGSPGWGDGMFSEPSAVALDTSGNLYVPDRHQATIQVFDPSGKFLRKWGSLGSADGELYFPQGIAIDSSGNVYVADCWNDRIQVFDSTGKFLRKWGSEGEGEGEFEDPYGIAVDSSGNAYVVDYWNWRVQKFDSSGKYLDEWGDCCSDDGEFDEPCGIAVDVLGNVYVADSANNRIQKFDPQGRFLAKLGSAGGGPGQFIEPMGVAVDSAGEVYVADTGNNRIQRFRREFRFTMRSIWCAPPWPPEIGWYTETGRNYRVWASADALNWIPVSDVIPAGQNDWMDWGEHDLGRPSTAPRRFYRVEQLE